MDEDASGFVLVASASLGKILALPNLTRLRLEIQHLPDETTVIESPELETRADSLLANLLHSQLDELGGQILPSRLLHHRCVEKPDRDAFTRAGPRGDGGEDVWGG